MQAESLKEKATKGILWNSLDKFFAQGAQFIVAIILARILMPNDFGLIGMLSIFIAISQTFVESGMSSGLIQKKEKNDIDYSTVFVFNLGVSVFFYILFFFSAPLIAQFFHMPPLVDVTRVVTFSIVINALAIVQRTRLTIQLDFKTFTKVNIISMTVGGVTGIMLALRGFGVWALVFQTLTSAIASVILLWYFSHWKPSIQFSTQSFKALFGFGSKLLINGLYAKTFNNIYNVIIGKAYSATELGYYSRSVAFSEITAGTAATILDQVTYPILASLQDDQTRMVSVYSRLIKMSAFFIFPAMTLLAILADPIVKVFLTDKWIPVVPLLQWMSFARIFYPISVINMNILNAVGRSDLFLKVDLSKAPFVIIALIITIPMGVKAIVIGNVITSFISFFINAYMPGKMFGYGAFAQLKDMIPTMIVTLIMALVVMLLTIWLHNSYLVLLIGLLLGGATYIIGHLLFNSMELKECKAILLKSR